MGRLQKKCLVVSGGLHLALLIVMVVGPAFRTPPERPQRVAQISLLSASAMEAALSRTTTPTPEPDPVKPEPEPVKPEPEPVKPEPEPVKPEPEPVKPEPKPVKPEPEPVKPEPEPVKPKPKPEIKINFQPKQAKRDPERERREAQQRAAERQRELEKKRLREMKASLNSLGQSLTDRAKVEANLGPGNALANYRYHVKQAYDHAWVQPAAGSGVGSVVKVKVVVNQDGSIASEEIVSLSGHSGLNQSVRDALNRVRHINRRPPNGSTSAELTFFINFNLKDGRITG